MLSVPRVLLTLAGAAAAAFLVALLEGLSVARALADAGGAMGTKNLFAFVLADAGVLAPLALVVAGATLVGSVLLEPEHEPTLLDHLAAIRAKQMTRMRAAALTPAFVAVMFVATVGAAHAARYALGVGDVRESGLTMAIASVALTVGAVVVALALLPWFWKLLARFAMGTRFADPLFTGGVTLALVSLVMAVGIATGDPGGTGGLPGVGIFATLARPELDLRPVVYAIVLAAMAYLGGKLARRPFRHITSGAGVAIVVLNLGLTARASTALNASPALTDLVERSPLGKLSLAALRKATDRDHDGYSPKFGGGDCDDTDVRVNPTAIDIPGNGLDEDCTGSDARVVVQDAAPDEPTPAPSSKPARTYNVVLITVDTLRADLGFTGYPRPVTPNLDKLAEKSIVFERAYSTASYTAKAMGALMMGKYSSEAQRNWDHYTAYAPSNTFIGQRASEAGVHTFAGHCHYYFMWQTGYSRGFKNYDTSAIAPRMADNDSSITSDRLSDLAIRMMSRPENVQLPNGQRFLAWFHYFDPHTQYVSHPGAPDFAKMPGGPPRRALYDEEVWFTDKHVGRVIDHIQSQPWGADTAIIITADHGEAFGDAHGVKTHGHELWESLVRVPLIVYVPGMPPKRVKVKRSHIDVVPTILELLGAPPAPRSEVRGKSLLADARTNDPVERDVYLDMPEGPYNGVRRAIITGPTPGMKLIHFGGKNYQLFDLAADPGENEDLSKDPAKLNPILERMEAFRAGLKEVTVTGRRISD